ncbi:hypothetical protein CsatB_018816 [Cannabis sativa]
MAEHTENAFLKQPKVFLSSKKSSKRKRHGKGGNRFWKSVGLGFNTPGKQLKFEGGKIYGVPLGGTIVQQPFSIGGSGSSYLYGFFDQAWKEEMTKEEAEKLVVKAVSLAIARDGASGGVVLTVIINSEGVTRNFYPGDQLPLWHEELESHNSLLDILNSASPEPMSIQ